MYTPTKERIEELKAEHGDLFKITIGDKCGLFKTPSRKQVAYSMTFASKDPLRSNEVILKDAFVEGDKELLEEDAYFLTLQKRTSELFQIKESKLEKL